MLTLTKISYELSQGVNFWTVHFSAGTAQFLLNGNYIDVYPYDDRTGYGKNAETAAFIVGYVAKKNTAKVNTFFVN